jgi:hypothetical protein
VVWGDKERVSEGWREYRGSVWSMVDWRTRKNQPMYTKDNDPTTGRTASFIHLVYHKLSGTLQFLSLFYISLSFVHHFLFTKESTRQALALSCSLSCTLFFMQNEHPSC